MIQQIKFKAKLKIKLIALTVFGLLQLNVANAESALGCLIEPEQIAEVGSQVIGVADTVLVERGDFVRKGQILAMLKSDLERANFQVAKTKSQFEADVKTAQANLYLAQLTEKRGEALVTQKFISQQALDKSRAETTVAEQKVIFAKEQLKLSSGELEIAKAQLNMRAIRSPIDGIIAERYVWPGERVEEKALFRVAKINPLRVEIVAPIALYGTIEKNSYITVTPNLPNSAPLEAKVVMVDKLIDGASNTFRVRAHIKNANSEIPSGLRCKASLQGVESSAANTVSTSEEVIVPTAKKTETKKTFKKAL